MRLNITSIALIGVLPLSISAYFIFIPNFETQEFNLDTIANISEGITTTIPNGSTNSESSDSSFVTYTARCVLTRIFFFFCSEPRELNNRCFM